MKGWILLTGCLVLCLQGWAQVDREGLGLFAGALDYYGPASGHYFLHKVQQGENSHQRLSWNPFIQARYQHQVYKHTYIQVSGLYANLQVPASTQDPAYLQAAEGLRPFTGQLASFQGQIEGKYIFLQQDSHCCWPFISAGYGCAVQKNHFNSYLPAGAGLHLRTGEHLLFTADLHYAVGLGSISHLQYGVGCYYTWKSSTGKSPQENPGKPVNFVLDSDNDGIPDKEDACPTEPGKKELKGCPDRDGDGIADKDDLCPDVKGLAKFNGCPDTDGDGVPDNLDECPTVPGLQKYNGCPIPDRDGDGFNDEVDKCPDVASKSNQGCPEIKKEDTQRINLEAEGIYFETNSATIKESSYSNLDKIAEILLNNKTYLIDIEGHTDNTGTSSQNQLLSQQRADACKNYLMSKGLDSQRIFSKGYGDTRPVAGNETEAGRAKNRRTEFKIRSY